jgi:hypothetical protein
VKKCLGMDDIEENQKYFGDAGTFVSDAGKSVVES